MTEICVLYFSHGLTQDGFSMNATPMHLQDECYIWTSPKHFNPSHVATALTPTPAATRVRVHSRSPHMIYIILYIYIYIYGPPCSIEHYNYTIVH